MNPYKTVQAQSQDMNEHYNLMQSALKVRPSEKSLPVRRPMSAQGHSKFLKIQTDETFRRD